MLPNKKPVMYPPYITHHPNHPSIILSALAWAHQIAIQLFVRISSLFDIIA